MARWAPCKRSVFIDKLKKLGFIGPEKGTKHEFMLLGCHKQVIPRDEEFSVPQVKKLVKQVEYKLGRKISLKEWNQL